MILKPGTDSKLVKVSNNATEERKKKLKGSPTEIKNRAVTLATPKAQPFSN